MTVARLLLLAALISGCASDRPARAPTSNTAPAGAEAERLCRIRGRVIDEGGLPVPLAQVSDLWTHEGGNTIQPFEGVQADAKGCFEGVFDADPKNELLLVAYSPDRRLAGIAGVAPEEHWTGSTDLVIVAQPTRRVRGSVSTLDQGFPQWTSVYWFPRSLHATNSSSTAEPSSPPSSEDSQGTQGARGSEDSQASQQSQESPDSPDSPNSSANAVVQAALRQPFFDLPLPQGNWRWLVRGTDLEDREGELELAAEASNVDLGVLKVPPSVFATQRGKKLAEWKVTASRGRAQDQCALASFRGKWLLVAFWGTWCQRSVTETLPRLVDFCGREPDLRPFYEVLAFHDGSVRSLAELDAGLSVATDRAWKGRELPFPILLDSTGETIRALGIRTFPTTILIDPDGRLVGEGDEKALLQRLESERANVR